jgi:hypothetical protein
MKTTETIYASGHKNILSTNKTTFEITKETHLTKQGDCIIAVGANKGAADLSQKFRETARNKLARMTIKIEADHEVDTVNARGNPQLSLTHATDLVVRKSEYVSDRTLAICADKAAKDLSRELVERLQNPNQVVKITLAIESPT